MGRNGTPCSLGWAPTFTVKLRLLLCIENEVHNSFEINWVAKLEKKTAGEWIILSNFSICLYFFFLNSFNIFTK